ncbi:MAG: hypothetical protein AB7I50_00650 [Vicinamibacterales bacterium]
MTREQALINVLNTLVAAADTCEGCKSALCVVCRYRDALDKSAPSAVQPRSMEFFATKFTGLGCGKVGECRVVIRTDRKNGRQFVQIIDDDGAGVGFTPREVQPLIDALTQALSRLAHQEGT